MDAHVFLILLLASLPLIKIYGDSRWAYLIYATWVLLFITFDLNGPARFDLIVTEWMIAILLVLGFRYRRFFGLQRSLGWAHWGVLFLFYVLSVWVDTAVLMIPERVAASGSILGETLYILIGTVIVGFLPLALFWVYQRLAMPSKTKAT